MSELKLFIYGEEKDFNNTLKFLPNYNDNFIYIKSIKEFINASKNHDTFSKSAILKAGMAVPIGFYEYFNGMQILENEIVFTKVHKAIEAPDNGIFKRSILIDKNMNINFIMSNSHLLSEILQDGWQEFNKNIKELELKIFIDDQIGIYEINENIISQHEENCSIFKQLYLMSNDIKNIQENGVSPEEKVAALSAKCSARTYEQHQQNKAVPLENHPQSEHSILEDNQSALGMVGSYFAMNEIEQKIKQKINNSKKSENNPDHLQYIINKYNKYNK